MLMGELMLHLQPLLITLVIPLSCREVVGKTIVVPPMAKVAAPAKVDNLPPEWEGIDVLAQPVQAINKNCLMPYVLTKRKANVSVHLVNHTENFVTFKSGTLLSNLVEVKKVYEEDNPDEDVPFLDDDISVWILKTPKDKSTTKDSSSTNEDDVDVNIASNVTNSDDAPYL